MSINEILVVAMFASFIGLLFAGLPVGHALGGVGVAFALIGFLADEWMGTRTGLGYSTMGLVVKPDLQDYGQLDSGGAADVYFHGRNAGSLRRGGANDERAAVAFRQNPRRAVIRRGGDWNHSGGLHRHHRGVGGLADGDVHSADAPAGVFAAPGLRRHRRSRHFGDSFAAVHHG